MLFNSKPIPNQNQFKSTGFSLFMLLKKQKTYLIFIGHFMTLYELFKAL
jgi:hypothetical protein